jgi:uncharacterized coiled-coil protein SlyX
MICHRLDDDANLGRDPVDSLEQRVAYLEGRAVEQTNTFDAIKQLHADLIGQMRQMDTRMGLMDARMGQMDARMGQMESRLNSRMDRIEVRMDGFDHKLDQRFGWLIGIQVATLLAMVASFVGLAQLIAR